MTLSTHAQQQETRPDSDMLQTLQEEIGAYWAAHSVVSAWSAGAQALALLRAALAAGVLDAVRPPAPRRKSPQPRGWRTSGWRRCSSPWTRTASSSARVTPTPCWRTSRARACSSAPCWRSALPRLLSDMARRHVSPNSRDRGKLSSYNARARAQAP